MLAIAAYHSLFLSRRPFGVFFSRQPYEVVTIAHHGVALPSHFAASAGAPDAGLVILVLTPVAGTAFPTAVAGSTTMAVTYAMNRIVGANALRSIYVARTAMGTWARWYIMSIRAIRISISFASFLPRAPSLG